MKRLIIAIALGLLCACVLLAQSRGKKRVVTPAASQPAIVDIRQIDFRNYSYLLEGKSYKLRDGFYAETRAGEAQWELGMIDGLYYGDLTGDGKDEVAFVLSHGTANAPDSVEARVYTLQGGRPVLLVTFVLADSVNCEVDHYIKIEDGMISVERVYGNGARCDHDEVTEYRWNGGSFNAVGPVKRLPCRCM